MPVFGDRFRKYGGATTCYSVEVDSDHQLLIDCGTGALDIPSPETAHRFSILITHMHWDHTLALPFFAPLYQPDHHFDFYGRDVEGLTIEEAIDHVMQPPWFPIHFTDTPASKAYFNLGSGPFTVGDIRVTTARLNHPSGVTAYRLDRGSASLVVATDNEHGDPESDRRLLTLGVGDTKVPVDVDRLHNEFVVAARAGDREAAHPAVRARDPRQIDAEPRCRSGNTALAEQHENGARVVCALGAFAIDVDGEGDPISEASQHLLDQRSEEVGDSQTPVIHVHLDIGIEHLCVRRDSSTRNQQQSLALLAFGVEVASDPLDAGWEGRHAGHRSECVR